MRTTLRYDADLTGAMAQVKSLTGQVGALNLAFNSLDRSAIKLRNDLATTFAANLGAAGGFRAQLVDLTSSTEKFGKAVRDNKLSMRESFTEAFRGLTRQKSLMRELAQEQVRFSNAQTISVGRGATGRVSGMALIPDSVDFSNAANRMKKVNQEFSIFRQLVDNGANSLVNMGKQTQWTGRQLTVGLTMPVVLFGATFARTFMDIDKELTRFAKVYGNDAVSATTQGTAAMKQQVMDLARTISTEFGVAAKDTVALAADIAATGKEGQGLINSVVQTNRLAVLGEVDRQEAMKATLALQTAFKISSNDLADSINFLNAIENQTSTTLNDLVEAIPRVGPVVKSLGGDVKDLSVLMVAMREGGIPAAEAANAIKSGMASLINPTQKASDVAKEFGINLQGIVDANQGQLMPTLFALQGALDGLDSFSRSRIIEQIFGKYQFARISALFSNLGKAGSQTEQAMRLAGSSTADLAMIANKELTAYTESTTVKFKRMVETVKNQLIPMGSALLEMLTPALDKLSGILDFMKNAFSALPGFLKEPLKLLAGFALAAGPILMLLGLFKQLIGNGIKFGMSIVTLGAKLAGIKTDKFRLLDAETAAAASGIDKITIAAEKQKTTLRNLNVELGNYLRQLQQVNQQNPNLFSTAPTTRRVAPVAPRRYGNGGMTPGSGNSDTIPALLTPGEFVVKKSAAQRYRGILDAMNSGTIKGFNGGTPGQAPQVTADDTQLSHLFRQQRIPVGELLKRTDLNEGSRAMLTLLKSIHGANFEVSTFSNGVIGLRASLNQGMERGAASLAELSTDIESTGTAFDPLKRNLRDLVSDTGDLGGSLSAADTAVDSFSTQLRKEVASRRASGQTTFSSTDFEDMSRRALGRVSNPAERAALERLFNTQTTLSVGRGVTAANMYALGQGTGTPVFRGGTARDARMYVPVGDDKYLSIRGGKGERIPLTGAKTYQGSSISPLVSTLPAGTIPLENPRNLPSVYSGSTKITKPMATAMGTTQLAIIQRNIEQNAENFSRQFVTTAQRAIQEGSIRGAATGAIAASDSHSASREAQRVFYPIGGDLIDGALIGLQRGVSEGMKRRSNATGLSAGRAMAGNVVSPIGLGLESVSTDAKITRLEQSILRFKEKQHTFMANRVRAEGELVFLANEEVRIDRLFRTGQIGGIEQQNLLRDIARRRIIEQQALESAERIELGYQRNIDSLDQQLIEVKKTRLRQEQLMASGVRQPVFLGMPGFGAGGSGGRGTGTGSGTSDAPDGQPNSRGRLGNATGVASMGLFGVSALLSTVGSMNQSFGEATSGINNFVFALSSAMMVFQMVGSIKGMMGGGSAASGAMGASRFLALGPALLNPWVLGGVAAAAAVAGVAFAIYKIKSAAEEARKSAISMFQQPTEVAKYFGKELKSVTDSINEARQESEQFSNAQKEALSIDPALVEVVKTSYSDFIQRIRKESAPVAGYELALAFNDMLIKGLDASQARATVLAIAQEAGQNLAIGFMDRFSLGKDVGSAIQSQLRTIMPEGVNLLRSSATQEQSRAKGQADLSNLRVSAFETAAAYPDAFIKNSESIAKSLKDQTGASDDLIKSVMAQAQAYIDNGTIQAQYEKELGTLTQAEDDLSKATEALNSGIEDTFGKYSASRVAEFTKSLMQVDKEFLPEVIKGFEDLKKQIVDLGITDLTPLKDQLKAIYPSLVPIIDAINNINTLLNIMQGTKVGVNIDLAIVDGVFDEEIYNTLTNSRIKIISAQDDLNTLLDKNNSLMDEAIGKEDRLVRDKLLNAKTISRAQLKNFDENTKQMDETFAKEQEASQAKLDGYNEEKDLISKSADAYVKSLERKSAAESFYRKQTKTGLDALQKLASGDVFGFLEARDQMSADATTRAYDQTIQNVNDRKDAELGVIDEKIKLEEDFQKVQQKTHDDAMANRETERSQLERHNDGIVRNLETRHKKLSALLDLPVKTVEDLDEKTKRYAALTDSEAYPKDAFDNGVATLKLMLYYTDLLITKDSVKSYQNVFGSEGLSLIPGPARLGGSRYGTPTSITIGDQTFNLPTLSSPPSGITTPIEVSTGGTDSTSGSSVQTGYGNSTSSALEDLTSKSGGADNIADGALGEYQVNGGLVQTVYWDKSSRGWKESSAVQNRASGGAIEARSFRRRNGFIAGAGGPREDRVPAMLSNGEYVVKASSVAKYGRNKLEQINQGILHLAEGGDGETKIPDIYSTSPKLFTDNFWNKGDSPQASRGMSSSVSGTYFGDGGGGLTSNTMQERAVEYAKQQLDKPYSNTAQPPDSWDCSKLVASSWKEASDGRINLYPYTYTMVNQVSKISDTLDPSKFQMGDLLFFFKNGSHHVSMWAGNNQVVEAQSEELGINLNPYNYQWNIDNFSVAGRPHLADGGYVGSGKIPKFMGGGYVSPGKIPHYRDGTPPSISQGVRKIMGMYESPVEKLNKFLGPDIFGVRSFVPETPKPAGPIPYTPLDPISSFIGNSAIAMFNDARLATSAAAEYVGNIPSEFANVFGGAGIGMATAGNAPRGFSGNQVAPYAGTQIGANIMGMTPEEYGQISGLEKAMAIGMTAANVVPIPLGKVAGILGRTVLSGGKGAIKGATSLGRATSSGIKRATKPRLTVHASGPAPDEGLLVSRIVRRYMEDVPEGIPFETISPTGKIITVIKERVGPTNYGLFKVHHAGFDPLPRGRRRGQSPTGTGIAMYADDAIEMLVPSTLVNEADAITAAIPKYMEDLAFRQTMEGAGATSPRQIDFSNIVDETVGRITDYEKKNILQSEMGAAEWNRHGSSNWRQLWEERSARQNPNENMPPMSRNLPAPQLSYDRYRNMNLAIEEALSQRAARDVSNRPLAGVDIVTGNGSPSPETIKYLLENFVFKGRVKSLLEKTAKRSGENKRISMLDMGEIGRSGQVIKPIIDRLGGGEGPFNLSEMIKILNETDSPRNAGIESILRFAADENGSVTAKKIYGAIGRLGNRGSTAGQSSAGGDIISMRGGILKDFYTLAHESGHTVDDLLGASGPMRGIKYTKMFQSLSDLYARKVKKMVPVLDRNINSEGTSLTSRAYQEEAMLREVLADANAQRATRELAKELGLGGPGRRSITQDFRIYGFGSKGGSTGTDSLFARKLYVKEMIKLIEGKGKYAKGKYGEQFDLSKVLSPTEKLDAIKKLREQLDLFQSMSDTSRRAQHIVNEGRKSGQFMDIDQVKMFLNRNASPDEPIINASPRIGGLTGTKNSRDIVAKDYMDMYGLTEEDMRKFFPMAYTNIDEATMDTFASALFKDGKVDPLLLMNSHSPNDSIRNIFSEFYNQYNKVMPRTKMTGYGNVVGGPHAMVRDIVQAKRLYGIYEELLASNSSHLNGINSFDDFVNKVEGEGSIGGGATTGSGAETRTNRLNSEFVKSVNSMYAKNVYGLSDDDLIRLYRTETNPQKGGDRNMLGYTSMHPQMAANLNFMLRRHQNPLYASDIKVSDLPQIIQTSGYADEFAQFIPSALSKEMPIRPHGFNRNSGGRFFNPTNALYPNKITQAMLDDPLIKQRLIDFMGENNIRGMITRGDIFKRGQNRAGRTYSLNIDQLGGRATADEIKLIRFMQDELGIPLTSIKTGRGLDPFKLAMGGKIKGFGNSMSDSIPAMLSNGEYVVRASSVDKYGTGFMDKLNQGVLKMAGGGYVNASAQMPRYNIPSAQAIAPSSTSVYNGGTTLATVNVYDSGNAKATAYEVANILNNMASRTNHKAGVRV